MGHRAVLIESRILIGALIVQLFVTLAYGQQQTVVKGFRFAEPYEPPHQNQTKYLLTGAEGRALRDGKVLLKNFRLETFAKTGERQAIGSSPECIYDTVNRLVNSAGPMQMQTADGKFFIQGEGFLLRQTNLSMVISNKVETTLHNDLLTAQTSRTKSEGGTGPNVTVAPAAPIVNTNAPPPTNQITKVFSDHADFSSVSNLAIYSGNVRVVDSQMDLTCEVMTLRRSTNDSLESIVAETNVVIIGKQDKSRATGNKAVYIVNPEKETVELSGQAHWQDGLREVKADTFIFDRKDNTVRAEPNAYLKLPRAALDQTGPLSPKSVATDNPAGTNEFIEITSQLLLMQLPTTNRPSRIMIAETNVVILSPSDKSRATGDQAVYTEADGTFTLSGKAMWTSDQRSMSGNTLTFDTNQIFTARSNAYLRLPLTAFGKSSLLSAGAADSTNSTAFTNQFIEVFSDDCDYRDGLLTFRENVRGNFLEGEAMKGWMTCGQLTVELTNNQVKRVVAQRRVAIGQIPPLDETVRTIYKKLNCEILTVNISTNGQVENFVAEQNVIAEQNEVRPGTNAIHTKLTADIVTGYCFAQTNQVERMVAERNVYIEQGDRSAQGAKAVFTATNNLVELTGKPTAKMPECRITEAEALIWDRTNEKLMARGSKSFLNPPRRGTDRTNLRIPQ
jgi:lipopolysaccharide transport protein LptA